MPCSSAVFGVHQSDAAPGRLNDGAAEKFEAAMVTERITAVHGHETDIGLFLDPLHGAGTFPHDDFGQIGVYVILRHAAEIIEILLRRVFSEIGARDFFVAEVGYHFPDRLQPVVHHAKTSGREGAVSSPLVLRRALQHQHTLHLLPRREGGAQGGVTASDNDHVVYAVFHFSSIINLPAARGSRNRYRDRPGFAKCVPRPQLIRPRKSRLPYPYFAFARKGARPRRRPCRRQAA